MIKLFFYENYNSVLDYFQESDFNTPFLGSNLFDFVSSSYQRFAELNNVELEIYVPESWGLDFPSYGNFLDEFSDSHDIFIFTDVFNVPIADFLKEDYHFLIQNQDKVFSHESGLKLGFINNKTNITQIYTEELEGFNNIIRVDASNFLQVNQTLVNNFTSNVVTPGNYGNPVILTESDNIYKSRILGPSFVGEGVKIYNSVIYPGTIVTGNVVISNSEIFESFVCESSVKNSVLKNSLTALANLDEVSLENSIIPRGSVLNNVRKR